DHRDLSVPFQNASGGTYAWQGWFNILSGLDYATSTPDSTASAFMCPSGVDFNLGATPWSNATVTGQTSPNAGGYYHQEAPDGQFYRTNYAAAATWQGEGD